MWVLYWCATTLLLLLGWPLLLVHPKLRWSFIGRLGFPRSVDDHDGARPIWFHASSAGDVRAVWPVVRALGDEAWLLSCTTDSGKATAAQLFGGREVVALPLDHPFCVWAFLRRVKPRLLVLEYAELWPELLRQLHRRGVPVVVTNGTLSRRSVARYVALRRLFGALFSSLREVFVRDATQRDRFVELGVPADRVQVCGSTKIDGVLEQARAIEEPPFQSDLLVGSLHQDEFTRVGELLATLHGRHPERRLVAVPRYLQQADALVSQLERRGLSVERYSRRSSGAAVLVVDAIGVLFGGYAGTRVALVGGSLGARGGQNPLEPAVFGVPGLSGPNMENFAAEMAWLEPAGWMRRESTAELVEAIEALWADPEGARLQGEGLRAAVVAHAGVSGRIATRILQLARIDV